MTKFRASYTVLDMWANGNWEGCVRTYFKLDKFVTPGMEWGKRLHEEWHNHILETKTLPEVFGSNKLVDPKTEIKVEVSLSDWLDLVGIPDCIDGKTVYEFKTGKSSSETYASTYQAGVYGVLATMTDRLVDRAVLCHYDQYANKSDISYVWVTDELIRKTSNWIETLSSEVHEYFTQNGLYERYQK